MDVELLTVPEVAARLKTSPRQVFRLLKAGLLPARRLGRERRFYWPEVVDALPRATVSIVPAGSPAMDVVQMLKARVRTLRRVR